MRVTYTARIAAHDKELRARAESWSGLLVEMGASVAEFLRHRVESSGELVPLDVAQPCACDLSSCT